MLNVNYKYNQIDLDLFASEMDTLPPRKLYINLGAGKYLWATAKKRPVLLHKLRREWELSDYLEYKNIKHPGELCYDDFVLKGLSHHVPLEVHSTSYALTGIVYSPREEHTWDKNACWLSGAMNASRTFHVCCTAFSSDTLYRPHNGKLSAFGKELIALLMDDLYIFQPGIIEKHLGEGVLVNYYRLYPNPNHVQVEKRKSMTPERINSINFDAIDVFAFLQEKLMLGALHKVNKLIIGGSKNSVHSSEGPLVMLPNSKLTLPFVLYELCNFLVSPQTTLFKFHYISQVFNVLLSKITGERHAYYQLLLQPILDVNSAIKNSIELENPIAT